MAQRISGRSLPAAATGALDADDGVASLPASEPVDREKVLPLPGWLVKLYFIFPIVLYVPDAIFNFYVYSDGVKPPDTDPMLQAGFMVLWAFVSLGVVGMAYLLSVLAPFHWGQGHRIQAFFCGLGVLVATGITTWNSLSYRSTSFHQFATDQWVYNLWPQLKASNISLTMILVAVAPPFWGLFWAIVQPTQTGRSLRQLQESHAERLLRMQQDAELKRLRADTNAKIREAQLRGMAQTAAAAREQASGLFTQMRKGDAKDQVKAEVRQDGASGAHAALTGAPAPDAAEQPPANVFDLPSYAPNRGRDATSSRPSFMNNVAAASPAVHVQPAESARALAAQQAMFSGADVQGSAGVPASDTSNWGARRPATIGNPFATELGDAEAMTGTSGPRHAVRRPTEISPLTRAIGAPPREYVQAVIEARRELNPSGSKKSVPAKDLRARVAAKLDTSEEQAGQIIARVHDWQKNARS